MKVQVLVHISLVNQYLLAFIETKHDTMCFNLVTPLLNLELYIVFEYRHHAKNSTRPQKKKHKKALQPIIKKASHRKKAQKSTTVLLKALAMIPVVANMGILTQNLWKVFNLLAASLGYQQPKSGSPSKFQVAWGYWAATKSCIFNLSSETTL